mgnify:CR=1 FL=1
MTRTLISFIQDRSGSMASVWEETLNGFKTYVNDLQKDQDKDNEVEYALSLTTFDTQIDTPYVGELIGNVIGDRLKDFGPRGGTSLYDAVGRTLQAIDDDKKLTFDKAIVVIVTDGEENSSREWSKEALHAAIDERIKRGNWTFTYLGAQPETWDEATKLGMGVGASATYTPSNAQATYATMAFATSNMARSAHASSKSFLHDNTTVAMRCAVGMQTEDDADNLVNNVPATTGTTTTASHTTPPATSPFRRPGTPRPARVAKSRRWK